MEPLNPNEPPLPAQPDVTERAQPSPNAGAPSGRRIVPWLFAGFFAVTTIAASFAAVYAVYARPDSPQIETGTSAQLDNIRLEDEKQKKKIADLEEANKKLNSDKEIENKKTAAAEKRAAAVDKQLAEAKKEIAVVKGESAKQSLNIEELSGHLKKAKDNLKAKHDSSLETEKRLQNANEKLSLLNKNRTELLSAIIVPPRNEFVLKAEHSKPPHKLIVNAPVENIAALLPPPDIDRIIPAKDQKCRSFEIAKNEKRRDFTLKGKHISTDKFYEVCKFRVAENEWTLDWQQPDTKKLREDWQHEIDKGPKANKDKVAEIANGIKLAEREHQDVANFAAFYLKSGIVRCTDKMGAPIYVAFREDWSKDLAYNANTSHVNFSGDGKVRSLSFKKGAKDNVVGIEILLGEIDEFECFQVFNGPNGEKVRVDLDGKKAKGR
ncbi:MAG: hypothetical protein WCL32_15130 [Planctomycetota bacterium]